MSRAIGFLSLIGFAVVFLILMSGTPSGPDQIRSLQGADIRNALSPLAIIYGGLGMMLGFVMANLMRVSWMDFPRAAIHWLRCQRRRFSWFMLACLFGAVLLFY
jgi:hypothetical protein